MAGQLILGLAILVTLHELGHFLAARAFGIRVEKFYLFFDAWGIKLFSFKKGDTEYGIGWLPLGGYVKIAGMIDESMDKDQMAGPPQPWEFRSKPAWQRLIVMVGGVTMNVILGIAIFSAMLLHYKKEYLPNTSVTKGIHAYKLGEQVGLQTGDKILAIDGNSFERFDDLLSSRVLFGAILTIERNGQKMEIAIPDDFYRTVTSEGRWNFIGTGELYYEVRSVTPGDPAEKAGIREGDRIVAVNGAPIAGTADLPDKLGNNKGGKVNLKVLRNHKELEIISDVTAKGTIGIGYDAGSAIDSAYVMRPYTVVSALKFGTADAMEALVSNVKGLKKIFTGKEKATDAVAPMK